MKKAPHHMSSGKQKLKLQRDTTTHLFEWPELGTMTSKSDKDVGPQELSFIAAECLMVQLL